MRTTKLVGAGIAPMAAAVIAGGFDIQTGLTATGTSNTNALAVYADVGVFTTTAASTGAISFQGPSYGPGDKQIIINGGANALLVYPPAGAQINALTATTGGFSVAAGGRVMLVATSATQVYAILSA